MFRIVWKKKKSLKASRFTTVMYIVCVVLTTHRVQQPAVHSWSNKREKNFTINTLLRSKKTMTDSSACV